MVDVPSGREHRAVDHSRHPGAPDSPSSRDPGPEPGDAMPRLGIRDLRARLTDMVRRAGSGERIIITIAGRAVAQLGPVESTSSAVTIDDLAARGLIEPAHRGDRPSPELLIDSWTGSRLDRALREVRGA